MPDMEKVIKAYEDFVNGYICFSKSDDYEYEMHKAVLALLKEQKAVKPECRIIFDVPYYFCGNCKTMLNMYAVKAKYCSNCGKQVKWE